MSIPEYFKVNGYRTFKTGKIFHVDKKGVWDDMGAVVDYGPMAFNGESATMPQLS